MSSIPILRIRGHLLVPVQPDLSDEVVNRLQNDVLEAIAGERDRSGGLLLDISGLQIVDTYVARVLADTASMAALMGRRTVLCGMRPEIAATLVQMGYLLEGVCTALDVDDGLDLLGLPR
ncbi:MAG TPA: STAS domain-containing protein [Deltaproteobacteria bacterium]|nr:STAS domain-containing protein [Deltaproteobacteria bacterium]